MVLGGGIEDANGVRHAMAGLLPLETSFAERHLHLGYRCAALEADGPLGRAGRRFRGHEFHYARIARQDPGSPLFTVVDASELELAGRIGVQDAARVRVGQPVTFALDAFPNQSFRGRVARVDPTVDAATRQVGVYVRLPNPGGRIVGGQYARGRIEAGVAQNAVAIPEAAVFARSGDQASVLALNGNRVSRRQVTLGPREAESGTIAVITGLRAGERVLLNPSADIADGAPVSIASDSVQPAVAPTGR